MSQQTEPRGGWMGKALWLTFVLSVALSCRSTGMPERQPPHEVYVPAVPGYSGMAKHGPASYLVVHDTKAFQDRPRMALLNVPADTRGTYLPLEIADWKDPDGRSNDLESACPLPGRAGEYLIAESGYREGKYGRIFHLRVAGAEAEILRAYKLPLLADDDEHNYEGLACITMDAQRVRVILGERGGSTVYPRGLLRWGTLDLGQESLSWYEGGREFIEVESPGDWPGNASRRDISELHVSPDGVLWSVATADAGNVGTFRSVIYELGRIVDGERPVEVAPRPAATWIVDGLKVEALAETTELVEGSVLSFGSEDERLGGVWRALYPMVAEE